MEECFLDNFNSLIKPGERLYLLGDISWSTYRWEDFLEKLPTKSVHIIWGNHDDQKLRAKTPGIQSFADIRKLKMPGRSAILCHYAMRSWLGKREGVYMLYGHSHSKLPGFGRSMDVGIDTHDYKPWSWDEIVAKLDVIDPGVE